ncbi:MAG: SDR family oxidoreductase [Proteobacteria bacterium]|nr:SDR family oxidoreductase [Pseudomonadota bacterium]
MTESKRVALVTGAGSGVGRHSSLALLEAGYHLVLVGRREDALEETKTLAGVNASKCLIVSCDVSDPKSIKSLFTVTREQFGRLDLLFNNAGIGAPAIPLEELTVEQWKSVVDINLTGAFLCTQEAFSTATKHAITGLTRSSSLDGRSYNIACGQIDIGNAETDMTARMKKGVLQANGTTSTEPTIDPDHVAQALVYMAGLPLDANVQFMTVMATQMPFIGRG